MLMLAGGAQPIDGGDAIVHRWAFFRIVSTDCLKQSIETRVNCDYIDCLKQSVEDRIIGLKQVIYDKHSGH